jgi:hypothetical protein
VTLFIWTDRNGQRHELDGPRLIEAEADAVMAEMDQYVGILGNPDPMLSNPARAAIRRLQPRIEQLRADITRWNDRALAVLREEAAALAEQIDGVPASIAEAQLVVDLHDEHDRVIEQMSGSATSRSYMLAGPASTLQLRAMQAAGWRGAAETPARAEAKAWLDEQPRFARGSAVDGGWFAWADRHGHAHRLSDPLDIEREVVSIARELSELRTTLRQSSDVIALHTALNAGVASWERLQILQGDLERFEREAEARDQAAWKAYAADWRSKRKTTP